MNTENRGQRDDAGNGSSNGNSCMNLYIIYLFCQHKTPSQPPTIFHSHNIIYAAPQWVETKQAIDVLVMVAQRWRFSEENVYVCLYNRMIWNNIASCISMLPHSDLLEQSSIHSSHSHSQGLRLFHKADACCENSGKFRLWFDWWQNLIGRNLTTFTWDAKIPNLCHFLVANACVQWFVTQVLAYTRTLTHLPTEIHAATI